MKKNLTKAVCLVMSLFATTTHAQVPEEYNKIVEWYEEQALQSPASRRQILVNTVANAELEAFRVDGVVTSVPNIRYSADRDNPDCGDGSESDDSRTKGVFFKSGLAMVGASRAGGPGAPYIAAIGTAIAVVGAVVGGAQPHSNTSSCGFAFLIVPGHYDPAQAAEIVHLEYNYADRDGEGFVAQQAGANPGWALIGTPVATNEQMKVDTDSDYYRGLVIKNGPNWTPPADGVTCPVTVIAVQLKNWSGNRTRRLQLSGTLDKSALSDGACVDVTQVNKKRYAYNYVKALTNDVISGYYHWMREQVYKSVQ